MNNEEAVALTKRVFKAISDAKTSDVIESIVDNDDRLKDFKFDSNKYPYLDIVLTPDEMKVLVKDGYLSDEGRVKHSLERGKLTSLEKLLYSVLWKQGDLGKERHIVRGVLSTGENADDFLNTDRPVFHQFGKHLANRQEPIIDQHTVRAFKLFKYEGDEDLEKTSIRKKYAIGKADLPLIEEYKDWLGDIDSEDGDIKFHIDKVLYALGKAIKSRTKAETVDTEP